MTRTASRVASAALFCAAAAAGLLSSIVFARAQPAPTMPVVPVGYCQLTSIDTAALVSTCSGGIPAGASVVYLAAEAQAIRYRDDGTAPTATVGFPVAVNAPFLYIGTLGKLQVISQVAGAKLNLLFYKIP
jgi:hypothetical protein